MGEQVHHSAIYFFLVIFPFPLTVHLLHPQHYLSLLQRTFLLLVFLHVLSVSRASAFTVVVSRCLLDCKLDGPPFLFGEVYGVSRGSEQRASERGQIMKVHSQGSSLSIVRKGARIARTTLTKLVADPETDVVAVPADLIPLASAGHSAHFGIGRCGPGGEDDGAGALITLGQARQGEAAALAGLDANVDGHLAGIEVLLKDGECRADGRFGVAATGLESRGRALGDGVEGLVLVDGDAGGAAAVFGPVTGTGHVAFFVLAADAGQGDVAPALVGVLDAGELEVVGYGMISVFRGSAW